MDEIGRLQDALARVLAANRAGESQPHVLIVLPSYSVGESLLSHFADRIPALEHRYLVVQLMLHRIRNCEILFLCSDAPDPLVTEYYASLVPEDGRRSVLERCTFVPVGRDRPRSVAAKLLDRPELLDHVRSWIGGRPSFVEPWNVTQDEMEVALRLGSPINGTHPGLRSLGFKSEGRKLFRRRGIPVPYGREHIHTDDDVVDATLDVHRARPGAAGVVVKLDDSGAGDGNIVIRFADLLDPDGALDVSRLRGRVRELPQWFRRDLSIDGGIVEELVTGTSFSSPSAQGEIEPTGDVRILATHEQVLGGPDGQVYSGCRFPANPAYSALLAAHAAVVGGELASRGALGRFSVDFAAAADDHGRWSVYALEINLRKGGTTHPYSALRNLVPGRYDAEGGAWEASDGLARCYTATDNLVDEHWVGLPPGDVIAAVRAAGLQFDHPSGTGVVLHMLSGLGIDGRFGLTAIGRTPQQADEVYGETVAVVDDLAVRLTTA